MFAGISRLISAFGESLTQSGVLGDKPAPIAPPVICLGCSSTVGANEPVARRVIFCGADRFDMERGRDARVYIARVLATKA